MSVIHHLPANPKNMRRSKGMKNMLKQLERLFAAIGLAEEGAGDAAREVLLDRKAAPVGWRTIAPRQKAPAAGPARPARRAA